MLYNNKEEILNKSLLFLLITVKIFISILFFISFLICLHRKRKQKIMSKKNNRKHKCCECGKIAIWYNEYHNSRNPKYYCDDCVPRGSICNVDNIDDFGEPNPKRKIMWWSEHSLSKDLLKNGSLERESDSFYYEELDEFGRRSPSDDYTYQPNGFDKKDDEKIYLVCYDDILESIDLANKNLLSKNDEFKITDLLENIFLNNRYEDNGITIDYNVLMSKFGNYLTNKFAAQLTPNVEEYRLFYLRFKEIMKNVKVLAK